MRQSAQELRFAIANGVFLHAQVPAIILLSRSERRSQAQDRCRRSPEVESPTPEWFVRVARDRDNSWELSIAPRRSASR